jgi:hypothetical protein
MTLMIRFTACDIDISVLCDKCSILEHVILLNNTNTYIYISYIAILSYLYIRKTAAYDTKLSKFPD